MKRFQTADDRLHRHFYGPDLDPSDLARLGEFVARNRLSIRRSTGIIAEFEERFTEVYSGQHAQLTSSGTNGILAAMVALGLRSGDEVIFPRFGFHACVMPARLLGLEVRFAEVTAEDLLLDVDRLEEVVGERTRAVFVLHLFGKSVAMAPLAALREKFGFAMIEDCSHALCAEHEGRLVGTTGDVAVASFQQNKMITAGEGGVVWARDREVIDRIRRLAHPGDALLDPTSPYAGISLGVKFRVHPIVAWLAHDQFARREKFIEIHDRTRASLVPFLTGHGFELLQQPRAGDRIAGYPYQKFRVPAEWSEGRRARFAAAIAERGKLVKAEHFHDLARLPALPDFAFGALGAGEGAAAGEECSALAERVGRQFGIRLPMHDDRRATEEFLAPDLALIEELVGGE